MKKNEIGGALLVILGITIGIVIGVVLSKRGINVASVREGDAVADQQRVEVVYSARLPNHVNPFDLYKQFDQTTVLHAARQLNEKPLNQEQSFRSHAGS